MVRLRQHMDLKLNLCDNSWHWLTLLVMQAFANSSDVDRTNNPYNPMVWHGGFSPSMKTTSASKHSHARPFPHLASGTEVKFHHFFSPFFSQQQSSAIVKGFRSRPCFQTYASLGQIRLGAAKRFPPRFHRGFAKVSPRLRKFSWCLWSSEAYHVLGCQKVLWKVSPITFLNLSPSSSTLF